MTGAGPSAEHAVTFGAAWVDVPTTELGYVLAKLRAAAPAFVPTWLSACAVGRALPTALLAELDLVAARTERLRRLESSVREAVPSVLATKGFRLAGWYPSGLLRKSVDLDLVAPSPDQLWDVVAHLRGRHGMEIRSLTTVPGGPAAAEVAILVNLAQVRTDPFEELLEVDVSTHAVLGRPPRTGPAGTPADWVTGGAATDLAVVAAERWERRFSAKDVFDAAVLADRIAAEGGDALRVAGRWGLTAAVVELFDTVTRFGLPLPVQVRTAAGAVRRAKTADLRRQVVRFSRQPAAWTLQALQSAESYPGPGRRLRRRLWRSADRRVAPAAPVRTRLPGYGVPAMVSGPVDRPVLRSPAGDFLLVNGAELDERWLCAGLVVTGWPDPDPSG